MGPIEHPRRLLIVGYPSCDIAGFVEALTGSAPVRNSTGSVAGSIHEWSLTTKYYTVNLPVWIDEIADISEWRSEFSKPEAKEVIEAVGGWVCCFDKSAKVDDVKTLVNAIDSVITQACGYDWDGIKILAAYSAGPATAYEDEVLDDHAADHGFELVDANSTGTNMFGERQGFARIVESLEANDWNSSTPLSLDELDESKDELEALKTALLAGEEDEGDDGLLDDFENLVVSAQAIKGTMLRNFESTSTNLSPELGLDLPPDERRKVQSRAARNLLSQALKASSPD